MKIREIMTAKPKTASPGTTLAAAAHLLWEHAPANQAER